MVFNRFWVRIIAQVIALCGSMFMAIFLLLKSYPILSPAVFAGLAVYQVYLLLNYVDKTNRDLVRFLDSIHHDDFSVSFDSKKYGGSFTELEKSFKQVTQRFLQIRSEKEENLHYLNTVVQHVGIGLISYHSSGKVELINSAAKRLLQIQYLKTIQSLEKISKKLTDSLLSLKPGAGVFVELDLNNRKLLLSIHATQFKLRGKKYTLVSLQDIQNEIERERMATELHVAYQVQKSLLPRSNPLLRNFAIAGNCIPAREVGGDYYDFIPLGKNKLGIVIADVSGKGVPASIYMTLTKGILQSHMYHDVSAKDVLKKVNGLLYKTLEPGNFVSMFLAIVHDDTGKITCARAGHNEAFHFSSSNGKFISVRPDGIGLGLEKGIVFDQVVSEIELNLAKDDLLVLFTDGYTEAMNLEHELFGEERLKNVIMEHHDKPVGRIISLANQEVREFSRRSYHNDDMTMIILKCHLDRFQKDSVKV